MSQVPITLQATAGMRLLPEEESGVYVVGCVSCACGAWL